MSPLPSLCGSDHWQRRTLLKAAGLSGLGWLTPLADSLAIQGEQLDGPPKSVILLWMQGGISQLDTWDPHPGSPIAHGAKAIATRLPGVSIGATLPRLAERLDHLLLVRSVISKEGDHERATYQIKTGYQMDPSVQHASIGAVICHESPGSPIDIPTHVSILHSQWPSRGGALGAQWDAFKVGDPTQPIPDVKARVSDDRFVRRLDDLAVVESAFTAGRSGDLTAERTQHRPLMEQARRMMTSEQLAAFDVNQVPASERAVWGDTPFGRGCLAAARLIEAGVRCVEVTLGGWDTHVNNLEGQATQAEILDQAYSALIDHLIARGLLDRTVVICGTEFGRTPKVNAVEGRDHWPHGFSVAIAGGGFRAGHVHGATDPAGESRAPDQPVTVADLHATVQTALGIDPTIEYHTPINRPVAYSEGRVMKDWLL